MSTHPKPAPDADDDGFLPLLKKYWLPALLTILAVIFIAQNTAEIGIRLFNQRIDAPAWIVYAVLLVIGWVVGWFTHRRRVKKRTGL